MRGFRTVQWKIIYGNEQENNITIKGCIYVLDMYSCLLFPQHWDQQASENFPTKRGTWCATYEDACVMQWNQRSFTKTIKYDSNTNTPKMHSSPRLTNYLAKLRLQDIIFKTTNNAQTIAFFCSDFQRSAANSAAGVRHTRRFGGLFYNG